MAGAANGQAALQRVADPDKIIASVRPGHQALDLIHYLRAACSYCLLAQPGEVRGAGGSHVILWV